MRGKTMERVFVWQLPVRLFHWINALCIVVLGVTGYLIGHPLAFASSAEPYAGYWFGTVRFIHFSVAYILTFNFLFRIYWGFVGNKYTTWRNFIPLRAEQWKEIFRVLRVDIMLGKVEEPLESPGHNALAGLGHLLPFLVFLAQVPTSPGRPAPRAAPPGPPTGRAGANMLGREAMAPAAPSPGKTFDHSAPPRPGSAWSRPARPRRP